MAGEGSSAWPSGWPASLEEEPSSMRRSWERDDDAPTRSTSPFRRPSTTQSRPSTSSGIGDVQSMRRFQPHEPDEKLLHQQQQQKKQRFRQLLDEQIQEKAMRKAKEDEAKRAAEAEQAQLERQYQRQQQVLAQQKLGHVAALPNPPKQQQQRYVSSGGTTTGLSIRTSPTAGAYPPPVPISSRVPSPTSSSSSRGISARHDANPSRDVLLEVQSLLDELRFERSQMQVERQQMQLERETMMRERLQLVHERGLLARDRAALEASKAFTRPTIHTPSSVGSTHRRPPWTDFDALSPTSGGRHSVSPTFSPYRDTKAAASTHHHGPSRRFPSDVDDGHRHVHYDNGEPNPMEQSLIGISEFVALASVDENSHNRRVIQASGRYNWDRDDPTPPPTARPRQPTPNNDTNATSSSKLFEVKELVN